MKIEVVSILLMTVLNMSCSYNYQKYVDYSYEGEPNYKQYYIVDTIKIEDPIIAFKGNRGFVLPKSILRSDGSIDGNFDNRPDVLMLLDIHDLSIMLLPQDFAMWYETEKRNPIIGLKNNVDVNNHAYKKFEKDNVSFVLLLINANFFNVCTSCMDCTPYSIKNPESKIAYYKAVIPVITENHY